MASPHSTAPHSDPLPHGNLSLGQHKSCRLPHTLLLTQLLNLNVKPLLLCYADDGQQDDHTDKRVSMNIIH